MKVIGATLLHNLDGYFIDKIYYFKSFFDVSQGDTIVAKLNGEMQLFKVVEVEVEHIPSVEYIIQVVNTSMYDSYMKKDKELAEKKRQLAARLADLDQMEVYEILAEEDPVIYDLLADYKLIESQ